MAEAQITKKNVNAAPLSSKSKCYGNPMKEETNLNVMDNTMFKTLANIKKTESNLNFKDKISKKEKKKKTTVCGTFFRFIDHILGEENKTKLNSIRKTHRLRQTK